MKTYLPFLYATLLIFLCCNNDHKAAKTTNDLEAAIPNEGSQASSIVGKWKKIAYGEDVNKNGILEDNEKEKRPEEGSYEVLNFFSNGRYTFSGILGQMEGPYTLKNYNGKRTIFLYTDDEEGLSQKEKDESAARFEIRSLGSGKLVVVPPIYISMLIVYSKV